MMWSVISLGSEEERRSTLDEVMAVFDDRGQRARSVAALPSSASNSLQAFHCLSSMASRLRAGLIFAAVLGALYYWFSVSSTSHHPSGEHHTSNTFTRRIVAVGDLHGDFGNSFKVLRMANVIDDDGDWSGDVDYFVQTGDIVDRYVSPVPFTTALSADRQAQW
jgi:hypothetical protein